MRKVGVRRVWNRVNREFGMSIRKGHKHDVFSLISTTVDEFNNGEYKDRLVDMLRTAEWRLASYFTNMSELACSALVDECFGR